VLPYFNKSLVPLSGGQNRLEEPSRLLKIAADTYPHLRTPKTRLSKLAAMEFHPENLLLLHLKYPRGENWVLSPEIKTEYTSRYENCAVQFKPIEHIIA
jgi:hypothetical protein